MILQGLVPTDGDEAGDFNGTGKTVRDPLNNNLPFPGNVIPRERFDRIANEMIQYFPSANFIGVRPGVNFLLAPSDPKRRDQFTARIDHRFLEQGNHCSAATHWPITNWSMSLIFRVRDLIRPDNTHHLSVGLHVFVHRRM